MSTKTGEQTQRDTIELRTVAQAIDRILVRLLTLAPIVLIALLVSETVREYSGLAIAVLVVGAILFAAAEQYVFN